MSSLFSTDDQTIQTSPSLTTNDFELLRSLGTVVVFLVTNG